MRARARRGRESWRMTVALTFVGGCLSPNSILCSDGRICPAGSICDDSGNTCVSAPEHVACVGHAEDDGCVLSGAPGKCRGGACVPLFCGDREVDGLEECDGAPPRGKSCVDYGFDRGVLGCSSTCTPDLTGCGYLREWQVESSVDSNSLQGIWGSGPNDVYAVGGNFAGPLILHWDGRQWSSMTKGSGSGSFSAVWGSGPDDVFAVGPGIRHWDGTIWSMVTSVEGSFSGVWGSGPDDVFAVGPAGVVHWDGVVWQSLVSGSAYPDLVGVWGTGKDDVFIVGSGGIILHWDGVVWTPMATGTMDPPDLLGVWGSSSTDVYAVGNDSDGGVLLHWDGTAWTFISTGTTTDFWSVWGSGPDDVFVGTEGFGTGLVVLHWDGTEWIPTEAHRNGLTREAEAQQLWGFPGVLAIWGSGPDNVFAVARKSIINWPGTTESSAGLTVGVNGATFADVRGSDAFQDVFAVGYIPTGAGTSLQGVVAHWDGETWSIEVPTSPPLPALEAFWPASPTDLFVVGSNANDGPDVVSTFSILRGSGTNWTTVGNAPTALNAIWGSSANDVFAAGLGGTIIHWNGTSLESMPSGTTAPLAALWGLGPDDIFAVGGDGTVLRWDGTVWRSLRTGTEMLTDVWGTGPNDVYAVGMGTILHWDGTRWSSEKVQATSLDGRMYVGGSGPSDVFTCWGGGTLAHAYLGTWDLMEPGPLDCVRLYVTPQQVFTVGGGPSGLGILNRLSVTCTGPEVSCDDGWDNDCDGLTDGADPDCAGKVVEQCANLADDDGDGLVDCDDPDCATFPACKQQ